MHPLEPQGLQIMDYCWVVYASGFKESILNQKFEEIEKAFKYFDLGKISRMKSIKSVLKVFNNERKAMSFIRGVKKIYTEGFPDFKRRTSKEGLQGLEQLPGIGKITVKQLARNVGISDVVKNDIHIQRLTKHFHARDEIELGNYLSKEFQEKKGVIDVVLWRFCAKRGWKKLGYGSLGEYVDSL
jgi:endonuclease III